MLSNHFVSFFSAFVNDLFNFLVDSAFKLLSVGLQILNFRESNISDILMHAEFGDDLIGQVIGFLEIIISPSCHFLEEVFFGASASQYETNAV